MSSDQGEFEPAAEREAFDHRDHRLRVTHDETGSSHRFSAPACGSDRCRSAGPANIENSLVSAPTLNAFSLPPRITPMNSRVRLHLGHRMHDLDRRLLADGV